MIIIHGVVPSLPRLLQPMLRRALASSPVVVVTGARQTGKSTLVQTLGRDRRYITLDDIDELSRAEREPHSFFQDPRPVTIEEIQRAPSLLLAVKRQVDQTRTPGRFLLTGSADLRLMKQVSESLAGRAVYLTLLPLTRREQLGLGTAGMWPQLFATPDKEWLNLLASSAVSPEPWSGLARRGGYPTPAHHLRGQDERRLWFGGYTQTYLERDLRELAAVSSLVDFLRLMGAASLRLGNLVNQTELGRDVGMPQPTVRRHLALLEISYQLATVPAFAVNRTKRLIKTPKLYWSDTGLALFLAGDITPSGAHLENLVGGDVRAWAGSEVDAPSLLYWRASTGEEVDFVIEWGGKVLPIEVKATSRPRLDDTRGLRTFLEEYRDRSRAGLLLHDGTETQWIGDRILAVPWWKVV